MFDLLEIQIKSLDYFEIHVSNTTDEMINNVDLLNNNL
jgi:hypothetical protein